MATERPEAGGYRPLPSHYDHCFGCGREHPTGLHLVMEGSDENLMVRGSFTVTDHHQGAPGLAHRSGCASGSPRVPWPICPLERDGNDLLRTTEDPFHRRADRLGEGRSGSGED